MNFKRTLFVSAVMVLTMVFLSYLSHVEDVPTIKPLSTFPTRIGDWVGKEQRFDAKVYDVLGVDDSFLGTYRDADGRWVELYVGYYRSQREGELIHSPKNCLPGAGWNIVASSLEEVRVPSENPGKIKVIKLIMEKGTQRQIVLYWFQSRGRFIASEYFQKIYLVLDSITRHRTDGSFVRLIAPVRGGNEQAALEDLKGFAEQIIPVLQEYLPS